MLQIRLLPQFYRRGNGWSGRSSKRLDASMMALYLASCFKGMSSEICLIFLVSAAEVPNSQVVCESVKWKYFWQFRDTLLFPSNASLVSLWPHQASVSACRLSPLVVCRPGCPVVCGFSVPCCCLVAQSCLTLCNPIDCRPPDSSVHGIFWARILGWIAISLSKTSSWPSDRTCVSCISCVNMQILYHWATWEAPQVHGLLQERILEWVAIPFSWGFSWPRNWTWVSCMVGRFFIIWVSAKVP